jgi:hypothetical protein
MPSPSAQLLKVQRRIERLEESFAYALSAKTIDTTIVFIDTDGVVKSTLRLWDGKPEWVRGEAEVARAG